VAEAERQYQAAYREANRQKIREYAAEYRKAHREQIKAMPSSTKEHRRRWLLKSKYGVSEEDYTTLLKEQDGVCAICRKNDGKVLHVDHNHKTDEVRGLLCAKCNTALGLLGESIQVLRSMIRYVLWR
jgi:Recombination endonuclease VII